MKQALALTKLESRALAEVRRRGVLRPGDLDSKGIPRSTLYRLLRKRRVERQARGLYSLMGHAYTTQHVLAQVSRRVPHAVVSLLSALRFHELTTQAPSEVWITIAEKAREPKLDYPRLAISRSAGDALTQGIEVHEIEGVEVRVYSAAKTVADCFKFRNRIGVDVAVEALRDYTRKHRGGADDLARFASICRVSRVMQPYLDAIA